MSPLRAVHFVITVKPRMSPKIPDKKGGAVYLKKHEPTVINSL